MKKIILFLVLSVAVFTTNSQVTTTDKKQLSQKTSNKPLTIKITPPATAYKPAATTPVVVKQPALQLSTLEVLATASGNGTYQLTITYSARNDSTAAVRLDQLSFQGYTVAERDTAKALSVLNAYTSACGVSGRPVTDMLPPGGRTKDIFQCYNRNLNHSDKPYYVLTLKFISNPREQEVPFSRLLVPIRFQ